MPRLPGSPTARIGSERSHSRGTAAVSAASGKPKKSAAETWKALPEIIALLKPRKGLLLLGLALMAINRVAGLALPFSPKYFFDDVIGKHQTEKLLPLVLVVIGATIVQGITSFSLTQLLSKSAQRMITDMRKRSSGAHRPPAGHLLRFAQDRRTGFAHHERRRRHSQSDRHRTG